jgi:hypothetical protein
MIDGVMAGVAGAALAAIVGLGYYLVQMHRITQELMVRFR